MTLEQIEHRDLAWEVMKQGYNVREADIIVGLLLGPYPSTLRGCSLQDYEDSAGQPYRMWARGMNDD